VRSCRSLSSPADKCYRLAPMIPFENLLWNVWLPKVRSAINNEWSPEETQPAVKLYEAWSTFLPPFMWGSGRLNSKHSRVPLRSIVFPWLPFVGLRLEDLMNDARRKIKSLIRTWVAAWHEVDPFPAPVILSPAYNTYFRCTTKANGIQ